MDYWREVDLYVGGSEHATGHLLYSRFWQYFLYDHNLVPVPDYAKKLINQGMILGNSAYIYRLNGSDKYFSYGLIKDKNVQAIHVDIKFVNSNNELNIDELKNWQPQFSNSKFELENNKFFVKREVEKMSKSKYNVVNPDDICKLGYNQSISNVNYPIFNPEFVKESNIEYPVSFNGKLRFKLNLEISLNIDEIKKIILNHEKTPQYLNGKEIKKVIIVPRKIINIVC